MKDDRSLRLSLFVDGGTTFNRFDTVTKVDSSGKTVEVPGFGDLMRYSTGIALTWVSPMGPLKVSIAQPLNDQPSDNLQRFQFMFGQQF
jgi:outer membrane protein insertion porin family